VAGGAHQKVMMNSFCFQPPDDRVGALEMSAHRLPSRSATIVVCLLVIVLNDAAGSYLKEFGVIRFEPASDLLAEALGQRDHFIGFGLRRKASPLVIANVAFLAEGVQLGD